MELSVSISISYLAILVSILNLIQVITLLIQHKINTNRKGIKYWVLASAITGIGFLLNFLRVYPTILTFSIFLSVSFFILGMVLFYIGSIVFLDQRVKYSKILTIFLAMIAVHIYFTYIYDSFIIRRSIATFFISSFAIAISYLFASQKQHSNKLINRYVSTIYLLYAITYIGTNVPFFINIPFTHATTTEILQLLTYGTNIIFSTLWTFGYVLLINERLNEENITSLRNQEILFNTTPDAILITRLSDGTFIGVNDGFCKLTGFGKDEVIGKTTLQLDIWVKSEHRDEFVKMLQTSGVVEVKEFPFKMKNGTFIDGLISARIIQYQGEPHIISVTHNITNQKIADKKFRTLFELSPIGLSMVENDSGKFLEVNKSLLEMTDYTEEELLNLTYRDITPQEYNDLEKKQRMETGETTFFGPFVKEFIRKDGSRFPISVSGVLVEDHEGKCVNWGFIEDITERKRLQEKLKIQATTDELTGLFNRRHFLELANNELKRSIRNSHPLCLAICDLDRLKKYNDNYGHHIGDQALITFAIQCSNNIRNFDIIARYGGDEFVILLPETSIEEAEIVLERIRKIISSSTILAGEEVFNLSASIGIAALEHKNDTLDEMLSRADMALYEAKEKGRNCIISKNDSKSQWPAHN